MPQATMLGASRDTIHVLFCADPGYFRHLAVAAVSLAENNPHVRLDVHVFCSGEDNDAERRLRISLSKYGKLTLSIYQVTDPTLDDFFTSRHLPKETYLRIYAAQIIPSHIDRLLYLDSDLVVVANVDELWSTSLNGYAMAAAPDFAVPDRLGVLGFPGRIDYVNAGVLLINLDYWRRNDVTARLIEYIREAGDLLTCHDQDALNVVLRDRIWLLDLRWNVQVQMFRPHAPTHLNATTLRMARLDPAIIHFTGPSKPWTFRSRAARRHEYLKYLARTPWRNEQPEFDSIWQALEYRLGCWLSRVGIDYVYLLVPLKRAIVVGMHRAASFIRGVRSSWTT